MLARGRTVYEPPRYMTVNTVRGRSHRLPVLGSGAILTTALCDHVMAAQAIDQLLEVEERRKEGAYDKDTMCVGIARLQVRRGCAAGESLLAGPGRARWEVALRLRPWRPADPWRVGWCAQADDQLMVAGPMCEVAEVDFGAPLHCLVIAGSTHEIEAQALQLYTVAALRASGVELKPRQRPALEGDEDAVDLPDGVFL